MKTSSRAKRSDLIKRHFASLRMTNQKTIMKTFLILPLLTLPFTLFAQGPNTNANPPIQGIQAKNILINDDANPAETNIASQQAAAPATVKQGEGLAALFGSNKENETPCADCDKVKKALMAAHASSGSARHGRSAGIKRWSKTFSGRMHMKMKKTFARKHKVKSNYALCFNWH